MSTKNISDYVGSSSIIQQVAEKTKDKYANSADANKKGYFFPSDDIDPEIKKGEVWCKNVAEAMWSLFLRGNTYSSVDMISQIRWLRLYATGNQPKELYMDWLLDDTSREGYMSTNWSIFSPMSKYLRVILGRMESQDYNYVVNAIDPISAGKKEDMMWETWFNSNFSKEEEEIRAMAGLQANTDQKYVANNIQELEMFKEMGGFKLNEEAQLESVLDATDYISDIKTIKRKVCVDFATLNKAAIRDYYNPQTGLCRYEYMDWENLIVDYSNETDFKDIRFWGYVKFKTLNEVRLSTNMSEDELLKVIHPWLGIFGNMTTGALGKYQMAGYKNENGVLVYNQLRVPVFIFEYMSTDSFYTTIKNGKEYPQAHGKIINTDKKKTKVRRVNNVYGGEWIVGSNTVLNHGLQLNTSRQNPKEPRMSLHAIALPGKSIVETIIPNLDQIQLTKLRLESAIAMAKPQGLRIEIGALENIDLGDGTKSPLEIIKLARQTGDVVYRATTHAGQWNNHANPIDISQGGVGQFFNECINNFELNFNFIAELTGIDRISAASPRGQEQTATATKIAVAATNDALQPIFTSYVQLKESAAQAICPRIQKVIKERSEARKAYEGILGVMGTNVLSIGQDAGIISAGIKIEIKPTDEMVQDARTAATEALKPGKDGENITLADWTFFMDLIRRGRVRQAQALLQYRLSVSREQNIKMQQENMRLNGENAAKIEQQKAQNKIIELKAQEQKEIRVEAAKALFNMQLGEFDKLNELKKEIILSALGGINPTGMEGMMQQPQESQIEQPLM